MTAPQIRLILIVRATENLNGGNSNVKYVLLIFYLATPPLGAPETSSPYEDEMPNVTGASVEELVYSKVIVIIGNFDSRAECEENANEYVEWHLGTLDRTRSILRVTHKCYPDPKP